MKPPPHQTEQENSRRLNAAGGIRTSIRHVLIGRRVGVVIDAGFVLRHFAGNERVAVVAEFRNLQKIANSERSRVLPLSIRVLITPRQRHGIPWSFVAFLAPDGGFQPAEADFVDGTIFRFCNWHGTPPKEEKESAYADGMAKIPPALAATAESSNAFKRIVCTANFEGC
jgi:hypothetical protein